MLFDFKVGRQLFHLFFMLYLRIWIWALLNPRS